MSKKVIILAAGKGSKIWPYSDIRNKTMIQVAGKPILAHNIDSLIELGVEDITILAGNFHNEILHCFAKYKCINIIPIQSSVGTADTLLAVQNACGSSDDFYALYGDTIIQKNDLDALLNSPENSILFAKLKEMTRNHIGALIENSAITHILAHPRDNITHSFAGFHFNNSVWEYLKNTDGIIRDIQVGMMPPVERYIESAVSDMKKSGIKFKVIETKEDFFDIDKPWHILEANSVMVNKFCDTLTKNQLADGATIDKTADIRGFVKLGKNSKIGRNVIIEGNIIVGDNTIIDNGALIQKSVIIGSNVFVGNYCFIAYGTSIADDCFVGHAAELWGIIMRRVYLYHYMEMYGIIGENTDIGAGTMCGTLRFDDSNAVHSIRGRREIPTTNADAVYLGDFSRTGVGAIIMPGIKTGSYSLVGPGVILAKDLPSRKVVFVKQEHEYKDWGPERYGW